MRFLETMEAALSAPQFEGGDAFISRGTRKKFKNWCYRIPANSSESIEELDFTPDTIVEFPIELSLDDIRANDWVILDNNPMSNLSQQYRSPGQVISFPNNNDVNAIAALRNTTEEYVCVEPGIYLFTNRQVATIRRAGIDFEYLSAHQPE